MILRLLKHVCAYLNDIQNKGSAPMNLKDYNIHKMNHIELWFHIVYKLDRNVENL